jgi:hypothetical protein
MLGMTLAAGANPALTSMVKFRVMLQAVECRQIMDHPRVRIFFGDDLGEQSMRGMCLLLIRPGGGVPIIADWDPTVR